ncbi:glycosyltransferase [Rosistilla ulvae]|uniref:glycosyltransferase n=1 Tax=Rosistilla ulvae TaxID=1930277 RepID=UPI00119FAE84|nr:glycosyltransferase [Rosistilla ulvae]
MTGMPWGGSEVLWSRVAHRMRADAHQVCVSFRRWDPEAKALESLRRAGASVSTRPVPHPPSWFNSLNPARWPKTDAQHIQRWLAKEQPDLALVTLGYHLNTVSPAAELMRRQIPYAINVQCASPDYLDSYFLDAFRAAYAGAARVYFVSQENLERVETMLAMRIETAKIIDNPFNVSWDAQPAWPTDRDGFRLACVGRLHFPSKGQDLLIDVLRQDKWRQRNLSLHLYGESQGFLRQTEDLIARHGLQDQIHYEGFSEQIENLWANHHGLVLPSRFEGAALAVVEALLCNRVCVTTAVGRNRELIRDGETGFIAPAATAELIDHALEAAWQKRDRWQEIGQLAGQHIRQRYHEDPVAVLYSDLMALAAEQGVGSS